ncbi:hypothetical protein C5167_040769 [Papaver somniferum]|uniref:FRIGIDA-like protein n=1 Tax=Papaver somniferum TaxID=3469 RepID=A0A4Y7IK49_PAPSO|nr:hypothetical protein C5167_040769 [Papaver somniferum]
MSTWNWRPNVVPYRRYTEGFYTTEDALSVATLLASMTTKIQQLQQAFAELENHQAEKEFINKASEARELVEKRDAAVKAKEHTLTSSVKPTVVKDEDSSESHLTVEDNPSGVKVAAIDSEEMNKISDNETMDVKPLPELAKLCEEMDSKGLHKYLSDNPKNLATIHAKSQPKRPRANGGGFAPRVSNINGKSFYATVPDRCPPHNYENMHYVYPGHTNNHPSSHLGAADYNIPPNHEQMNQIEGIKISHGAPSIHYTILPRFETLISVVESLRHI